MHLSLPSLTFRGVPSLSFARVSRRFVIASDWEKLMSAEAERRGFYSADRRAFLGDGLPYNWTIQREHFESFTPILDFIHPIERLHETSRCVYADPEEAWRCVASGSNWYGKGMLPR